MGEEWSEIREEIGEGEEDVKVGEGKTSAEGKTLMDLGEGGEGLAGLTTPSNCPNDPSEGLPSCPHPKRVGSKAKAAPRKAPSVEMK